MNLEKHLVLNKYFLHLIGYASFLEVKEDFKDVPEGYNATNQSYFVNTLFNKTPVIPEQDLLHYDEIIKGYEDKLRKNRTDAEFQIKYFQYLAILFTECFFEKLSTSKETFIDELNVFAAAYCAGNNVDALSFSETDLCKLAYWMATGSGKTILMHINYWQIKKYFPDWENIILITPNAGLSKQHYEEYRLSGIPCKLYNGSEESLKTYDDQVLIIEITKLTGEKKGEGQSVDVTYFSEQNNLVFIDEGHKGQSSEEKTWKKLRESIGQGGFIFEYSATFGQVIRKNKELLLEEYAKAIIFDYSYRYFYTDGYGKDFYSYNVPNQEANEQYNHVILTAGILAFYEQLSLFEKYHEELKIYKVEKPLQIFVGSKVSGTKTGSDVITVIQFINNILNNPRGFTTIKDIILNSESGLIGANGKDIFESRFEHIRNINPSTEQILHKVFNGTGSLELFEIKNAEGEIALQTNNSNSYFGIINIGDVDALKKKIAEEIPDMEVKPDNISKSQFDKINSIDSEINVLIGSKKFIEGWNSWRVSNMGLLNMGSTEGPQIVQLFGRGVRLKGKNKSLKREESPEYFIKTLQTLSIFGINANYIKAFLDNIEKEVEILEEVEIPIRFNDREKWENKILIFKKDAAYNFQKQLIILEVSDAVAERVRIDLRPRITVADGFDMEIAEDEEERSIPNPLVNTTFKAFLNWNEIYLNLHNYKTSRGFHNNMVISKNVLEKIINRNHYELLLMPDQLLFSDFSIQNRLQQLAEMVLKDYCNKFYNDKEKSYLTKNLKADILNTSQYPELFPQDKKILVKVPKEELAEIETLISEINQFYEHDVKGIPTIHFDRHLYSPIAAFHQGTDYETIKTFPVKLNKGETEFINHLRAWLKSSQLKMDGSEIFVLRNLSKKGIGFFVETVSFYPDFILWIKKDSHQHVMFIDPKGIMMMGGFHQEKVIFCTSSINEIEIALQKKLNEDGKHITLHLSAYILSVTPFLKMRKHLNKTKSEFKDHHILFIDKKMQYLNELFEGKL